MGSEGRLARETEADEVPEMDHRSSVGKPEGSAVAIPPPSAGGGMVDAGQVVAERCEQQHTACMAISITIRDVPDDTRDELAARAARSGRSLQEYLRAELVELARHPDGAALMARVRERKSRTGSALPADRILAYRDADRR